MSSSKSLTATYTPTQAERDEADARLLVLKHRLATPTEEEEQENLLNNDDQQLQQQQNIITVLDWSNLQGITKDKHIAFLTQQVRAGKLNSLRCLYLPYHSILLSQCDELIEAFTEAGSACSIELLSWFPQCKNHPPPRSRQHLAFSGEHWWIPNDEVNNTASNTNSESFSSVTTEEHTSSKKTRMKKTMRINNAQISLEHYEIEKNLDDDSNNEYQINENSDNDDDDDCKNIISQQEEEDENNQRKQPKQRQSHHQTSLKNQEEELITVEEMESRWFTIGKLIKATRSASSLVCVCLPSWFVPEQLTIHHQTSSSTTLASTSTEQQQQQQAHRNQKQQQKSSTSAYLLQYFYLNSFYRASSSNAITTTTGNNSSSNNPNDIILKTLSSGHDSFVLSPSRNTSGGGGSGEKNKTTSTLSSSLCRLFSSYKNNNNDSDDHRNSAARSAPSSLSTGEKKNKNNKKPQHENEDEDEAVQGFQHYSVSNTDCLNGSSGKDKSLPLFGEDHNDDEIDNNNNNANPSGGSNNSNSGVASNIITSAFGPATEAVVRVFGRCPSISIFKEMNEFLNAQKSFRFHQHQQQRRSNTNKTTRNTTSKQHHRNKKKRRESEGNDDDEDDENTTNPNDSLSIKKISSRRRRKTLQPSESLQIDDAGTTTNDHLHDFNHQTTNQNNNKSNSSFLKSCDSSSLLDKNKNRNPTTIFEDDAGEILMSEKVEGLHVLLKEEDDDEEEIDEDQDEDILGIRNKDKDQNNIDDNADEDADALHPIIVAAVLRGLLDYCLTINQLQEPKLVSRMWSILETLLGDTSHVQELQGAGTSPGTLSLVFMPPGLQMMMMKSDVDGSGDITDNNIERVTSLASASSFMPAGVGATSTSSFHYINPNQNQQQELGSEEEREYQRKLAAIAELPTFRQQDALYQLQAERNQRLKEKEYKEKRRKERNNNNKNSKSNKKKTTTSLRRKKSNKTSDLVSIEEQDSSSCVLTLDIPVLEDDEMFREDSPVVVVQRQEEDESSSSTPTSSPQNDREDFNKYVEQMLFSGENDDEKNHQHEDGSNNANRNNNSYQHHSPASPVPQCRYNSPTLHLALDLILNSPFGLPRMTGIDFWNKLTTIDLSGQGKLFGDRGAVVVATFLRESGGVCPVERLALRSNHISDVGFDALIWALFDSENQYLRELDLRQNVIPDSAAKMIIPELRVVRCVLRTMLLEDNAISNATASLLATGLLLSGQPAAVRRIVANLEDEVDICRAVELARVGVEDLACKLLLQAIRKRRAFETLVSIDLSCNRITDDGAIVAARMIDACPKLKTMILYENEIGTRGAEALIASASAQRSLSRLDLSDQKPKPLPEHVIKRVEFAISLHGAPLTTQHQVASVIRGDPSASKVAFNRITESSFLRLSTQHIRVALSAVAEAPKNKIAIKSLDIKDHASEFPLCDISQVLPDIFKTISIRNIQILNLSGNGLDHRCVSVIVNFLSSSYSSASGGHHHHHQSSGNVSNSPPVSNFSRSNNNNFGGSSSFVTNITMMNQQQQSSTSLTSTPGSTSYFSPNNNSSNNNNNIQLPHLLSTNSSPTHHHHQNQNNESIATPGSPYKNNSSSATTSLYPASSSFSSSLCLKEIILDNNNFSASSADVFYELCLKRNATLSKFSLLGNDSISDSQRLDVTLACDLNYLGTKLKKKLVELLVDKTGTSFVEIDVTPFVNHSNNQQDHDHEDSALYSSSSFNNNNASFTTSTTTAMGTGIRAAKSLTSENNNNNNNNKNMNNNKNLLPSTKTRFGNFGAIVLSNAVSRLSRVRSLVLQKCAVSDDGADYLAHNLLRSHPSLTSVDLSHNNISVKGAHSLLDALKSNANIQQLLLDGNACSMDPDLYRELLATLKNNRQFASVQSSSNNNNNNISAASNNHPNSSGMLMLSTSSAGSGAYSNNNDDHNHTSSPYENRRFADEEKNTEELKPKLAITSNNKEYDESVRDYLREEKRLDDAIFLDAMQSHWRGVHGTKASETKILRMPHEFSTIRTDQQRAAQATIMGNNNNNNAGGGNSNNNNQQQSSSSSKAKYAQGSPMTALRRRSTAHGSNVD